MPLRPQAHSSVVDRESLSPGLHQVLPVTPLIPTYSFLRFLALCTSRDMHNYSRDLSVSCSYQPQTPCASSDFLFLPCAYPYGLTPTLANTNGQARILKNT